MRKKFLACLLILVVVLAFSPCTFAAGASYVYDEAGLLSAEQIAELESRAAEITRSYNCAVYIITVDSYSGSSVAVSAESYFNSRLLGYGPGRDGVVLFLSMDDRDYDLTAHGDTANSAFTDYGKDMLEDEFLDNFRDDDWYGGFYDYLYAAEEYLAANAAGSPIDTIVYDDYDPQQEAGFNAILIIGVPCLISLIVCLIFKSQMKTAKKQTEARGYISERGVNMRVANDQFLHRSVVRQVIQDNSNRSGGRPGGTTINAGGFSHRSGKF